MALGLSGMVESGVLLDETGEPLFPIWPWYDTRGFDVMREWAGRWEGSGLDGRRIGVISGLRLSVKPTMVRLLWASQRHPDAWQRVRR